jgi:hypothetical protein
LLDRVERGPRPWSIGGVGAPKGEQRGRDP